MNRIVIALLVAVHLVATIWHGGAHEELAIALPPAKNLFVYVVIVLAPIVAAALGWTRYAGLGLWLFFLSMLAALLFGAYHHYLLVSPDNIAHLPDGSPAAHTRFTDSAAAIAFLELLSAIYGAFQLGARRAAA
jgi:hypothetical protein